MDFYAQHFFFNCHSQYLPSGCMNQTKSATCQFLSINW